MAQSPDAKAATVLRHRLSSDVAAAGCEWFISVYMEQLALLYHGAEQRNPKRPYKVPIQWPTLADVAKAYNTLHLPDPAIEALCVVLIKIGFMPVRQSTKNVAVPEGKTPRTSWDFVTSLLRMRDVLDVVDKQAARIAALVKDYVLVTACASAEHFALAWLVGPYLETVEAAIASQATVKCVTKGASIDTLGASCIIDPLSVALELRTTTERVALKHWGPNSSATAVDKAWSAIADLFLRMGFPVRAAAETVLRFNRAAKAQPGLSKAVMRIAALDVPATHAARVGVLAALHELDAHHQAHHAKSEGRVRFDRIVKQPRPPTATSSMDDVVTSLLMAVNAANGMATEQDCLDGCFDDDDGDNDATKGIVTVVPTTNEVEALKDTVRALLETVEAQRGLIDKARANEVKSDTNDAQIVTEVTNMRAELDTLRREAAQLRKEAEQSATAALEAAKSAETYRKSYEETLARLEEARRNVTQARPVVTTTATAVVPPPPPPPPPPVKPMATLVANATRAKQAIEKTGERINEAEKNIDAKLADVSAKAKANATQTGVSLDDIRQQAGKLRKVSAAANKLTASKPDTDIADALRSALAKMNKSLRGGADNGEKDEQDDNAFKQYECRVSALYFAVLSHSLAE